MSNKNKKQSFDLSKRKKIVVPIFSDEFEQLELKGDSLFAVQSQVREQLDLKPRARIFVSAKKQLRDKLKTMTDEEAREILEDLEE